MVRYLKWFAGSVALAALLSGCATYGPGYYGYSDPYYGYSSPYTYDYGPSYYGYSPYYYTPGYYYGGPIFDFRYSDRDRHDYRGRSREYRGNHDRNGGNWDRNRGGNWDRDRSGRTDRTSAGPLPTSRTATTSGRPTRQPVRAAPPRRDVTASRDGGRTQAQGGARAPSRARDEQRE